jgi:hypothetical protein
MEEGGTLMSSEREGPVALRESAPPDDTTSSMV